MARSTALSRVPQKESETDKTHLHILITEIHCIKG